MTARARRRARNRIDGVENRVLIADKRQMIVARQLDELGARNARREVAALFDAQAAGRRCDG